MSSYSPLRRTGVVQTVAFRSYLRPDKDRAFNAAAQSIMREVAEERGFELPVGGRRAMFMSMQKVWTTESERPVIAGVPRRAGCR